MLGNAIGNVIPFMRRGGLLPNSYRDFMIGWWANIVHNNQKTLQNKIGLENPDATGRTVFPGRAYDFDGTNHLSKTFASGSVQALIIRVNKAADTKLLQLATGNSIAISAGALAITGETGTVYVDKVETATVGSNAEHHIAINFDNPISLGTFLFGKVGATYGDFSARDLRLFASTLTTQKISDAFDEEPLSDELAWWFCEDADLFTGFDASGNGYHLTKESWDSGNHVEGNWQSLMNKYGYNIEVASDKDIMVNGDFSSGQAGWTFQSPWVVTDEVAVYDGSIDNRYILQATSLNIDEYAKCVFDITAFTGGSDSAIQFGGNTEALSNYGIGTNHERIGQFTISANFLIRGEDTNTIGTDNIRLYRYFKTCVAPDMNTVINGVPSADVYGNDLVYRGQVKYNPAYKKSACFLGDGVAHASTAYNSDFNFTDKITVYAEVRAENIEISGGILTRYGSGGHRIWALLKGSANNEIGFLVGDASGNYDAARHITSSVTIVSEEKYWILATYKASTGHQTIEIGKIGKTGTEDSQDITAIVLPTSVSQPIYISRASASYYKEQIWNCKVYNDILTKAEIDANPTANLILNAPACEPSGTVYHDVSGNENYLTITSGDETNFSEQDEFHYLQEKGYSNVGSEMVNNPFNAAYWSDKAACWSFIEGVSFSSDGGTGSMRRAAFWVLGKSYRISVIVDWTSGTFTPPYDGTGSPMSITESGTYTYDYIPNDSTIMFVYSSSFVGTITAISIKENVIVPALSDKSTDAKGNEISHIQNNKRWMDETTIQMPDNIFELIQADKKTVWGANDITNAGGDNTTKWTDTNEDGLADDWLNHDWGQDQINSIVIGQRVTANETGLYYRFNVYQTKSWTSGKAYRILGRARTNTTTGNLSIRNGVGGDDVLAAVPVKDTDGWVSFDFEYIGGTLGAEDKLYFCHTAVTGSGKWFEIDLVERRMKQTSLGNELISNSGVLNRFGSPISGDFVDTNSDGVADGYTHVSGTGTPTIETGDGFDGNCQKITHVNGTLTIIKYHTGVSAISGKTYQITLKHRADVTNWRVYLRYQVDAFTMDLGIQASAYEQTFIVEATASTEIILNFWKASGDANGYLEFDEVTVKPIIDELFYESEDLGEAAIPRLLSDIPEIVYGRNYMNKQINEKYSIDFLQIRADKILSYTEHIKLLNFTKN